MTIKEFDGLVPPAAAQGHVVPVHAVTVEELSAWRAGLGDELYAFVEASGFDAREGSVLALPGTGGVAGFAVGLGTEINPLGFGFAARRLPPGLYKLAVPDERHALGFALGRYGFDRYRAAGAGSPPALVCDAELCARLRVLAEGAQYARDLINTPAEDMGPTALEAEMGALARTHGADFHVIAGDDLLDQNFPLIHAVGRAGDEAPRLLRMDWGRTDAPRISLVGKGVCFDTGGLDLKPSSAMGLMKKDMGGAANVLGLAHMIMARGLDIRLSVFVPAVENAVSGNAMRPGDIFPSRKGLSVQIDNTDAEGRLVLADAMALADEDAPDLMIDLATLTGAARVALGPDLPPFYTDDEALAAEIASACGAAFDPVWRLPLWPGYRADLEARIADLTNAPPGGFAGSIKAALFLERFVDQARSWAHFDIYGWAPRERAEVPEGGRDQAIRGLFHMLEQRYG